MLGSQTGTQSSCGSRIPSEVMAPGGRASLASAPLDPPIEIHLENPVSLTNHHQVNYTSVFVGFVAERWFHSITEWIWKIKIPIFLAKNNQVNLLKLYLTFWLLLDWVVSKTNGNFKFSIESSLNVLLNSAAKISIFKTPDYLKLQ